MNSAPRIINLLTEAIDLIDGTAMANWDNFPVGVGLKDQLEHVRFFIASRHNIPEETTFVDTSNPQALSRSAKELLLDEIWEVTDADNSDFLGWSFEEMNQLVDNMSDDKAKHYWTLIGNDYSRQGRHAVLAEMLKDAET